MTLKYPHRLTFIERGTCDSCGKKGKELVHTNANRFFGWQSCGQQECNDRIKQWYNETTIKECVLLETFGEKVKVKRSQSGVIEDGWQIAGDAHKEEHGGPHWVKVKCEEQHASKEIPVSHLHEWNN